MNNLDFETLKENEYLINIRYPNTFEYIPVLKTDRKTRVIKYINRLYDECEELKFRIDTRYDGITFINRRSNLDYFENKKVRTYRR